MRITIVQGAFFPVPPIRGGAVEKVWLALGREFARHGHTVTHISRLCDGLPPSEVLDGVQHVRVPGYDTPRSMLALKWRDLLYTRRAIRALPPADILVSNTFWLPLLLRDQTRGRIYVHVCRFPKGQLSYYNQAARLQCVSEAVTAAALAQCPACRDRVCTLPLPLPDGAWEPNPLTDAERQPIIFYAGRIHPEKGLDLLAQAWRKAHSRPELAGWKLVLAGPWAVAQGGGGEDYRKQLLAQFPADGSVEWTGPLFGKDNAKLDALYRQARIFVYPSIAKLGESFGLAPLEAMAAGTPCVVSNLACFQDFLVAKENGLVFDYEAPDASTRLAETLTTLASDPTLRIRLGSAAWRTAARFRVEEVATRYLADFDALLKPIPA
jgi:glycosyltransferase involved in cell wall biosynthesis